MDKDEDERIAQRFMPMIIRRYRDRSGLSQRELAEAVGVSKGYISGMEGGRDVPNINMLIRIAWAMDLGPEELIKAMMDEYFKQTRHHLSGANKK